MDEDKRPALQGSRDIFDSALISLDTSPSRKRSKELSPLASLFPRVGTTEILHSLGPKIKIRLAEIELSDEAQEGKSSEEGMLRQVLQWLNMGEDELPDTKETGVAKPFSSDEFIGIYELARLYYEMGFLTAAERVLNGLVDSDDGLTPARGALGLVNLESGKAEEAVLQFRASVKNPQRIDDILVGKLGLIAAFLSVGDIERAGTLVSESEMDLNQLMNEGRNVGMLMQRTDELRELWQAFALRCGLTKG